VKERRFKLAMALCHMVYSKRCQMESMPLVRPEAAAMDRILI